MKAAGDTQSSIPVTPVQIFWAVCAVIGLAAVGWPAMHTPDAAAFLAELRRSWSGITVSLDLVGLGIAATSFAVIESRRLGMRLPWIWIPLAIPLPGAALIPLFFLLRERALLRASASANHRTLIKSADENGTTPASPM
jgi:hypothetical protein